MSDKYNLIDLGNISEPAAGVINNFIDKISNVHYSQASRHNY